MCISTTKHGVKKLVESMDELKRPSQLFFFYTLHNDGINHTTNGINCQTILKFNEFSCDSHTGRLHQRVEAMLHDCSYYDLEEGMEVTNNHLCRSGRL